METGTKNPAHAPPEDLVWLARPLLELAQERSLEGVLRKAIDAAAAVPGVALARVYLLEPGDILNAVVSGGHWLHGATEQWLRQEDDYRSVLLARIIQTLRLRAAGQGHPGYSSRNSRSHRLRRHTTPLPPRGEVPATGCPTGQPVGWRMRSGGDHTRARTPADSNPGAASSRTAVSRSAGS